MAIFSDVMLQRELEATREITGAFLAASRPLEVYRLAVARVVPLVHASFGSVFLRDAHEPQLLKLVCAQNWPQSSARFLGQLRIRVGRGPTGRAVAEGEPVEVEDVFADPALREWWEPARELGFTSLIALPLGPAALSTGALTFYFEAPRSFSDEERALLRFIAAQLSATVQRASRIEELEHANRRLRDELSLVRERVRDGEEARRLKDEFLANVSHELRTPLTSILGYAYLLREQQVTPLAEEQRVALAKIERAGGALQRLISDLIELSQLKLGRIPVEIAPADALELAEHAVANTATAEANVPVRLDAPDGRIPIYTDAGKALKILENLLSNALKFTSEGEVVVCVRRQARPLPPRGGAPRDETGGVVEWVVRDTGIGVRPEDVAAIFDEFRQVDGSSTRLYGGTGLGLALSLRLARLLHGEIHVESEPGRGSTFTLRLPTRPPADPAA